MTPVRSIGFPSVASQGGSRRTKPHARRASGESSSPAAATRAAFHK
jgi:hypothetical protein